jgi:hypothetical protein
LVDLSEAELIASGRRAGAVRPPLGAPLAQQRMYWGTRFRAARLGRYRLASRALAPYTARTRLELAHLLWAGGEMILLVQKPVSP